MKLIMTGLDHKRSGIDVREKFSFTKDSKRRALLDIKEGAGVGGCAIIATCNRTELYASFNSVFEPTRALCSALGRGYGEYRGYFTEREGDLALGHLCRVAAGADSQILGDDQIITQAREGIEFAREAGCADGYTETMFRLAVQAAKAIKTGVMIKSPGANSVPRRAVEKLSELAPLAGKKILVIGNGKMGRLTSELLLGEGAQVTVTLREYKNGAAQAPQGALAVGYSERYGAAAEADIVISATASPHYTLRLADVRGLARLPGIFVDLAVPRDIDPGIQALPGVTLLTVDDIPGGGASLPPESAAEIDAIVAEHVAKYNQWLAFKEAAAGKGGGL